MSDDDLYAEIPIIDERSRHALTVAEKWIGEGIEGVAIGAAEDGGPAVVVYAVDPTSDAVRSLPKECEGLPVRVETGDAFSAED
ncbi:hypothetical protein G5C66_14265 [Nocardioides sp. KC13]|uniref:Uncharacterized protein n=1 Tax=Nocardioides turkmenicus TaxID=2711220 RepID=A0A6M1R0Y9_9ACTN|nr:hypothetical protein [Nocardioides sp. KC13]NGN93904.1 hypothetical protein [Nocardioides sp. KC13]